MLQSLELDDDREWIQFWIEDEEWLHNLERIWRENIPGYRPYKHRRGVIRIDTADDD